MRLLATASPLAVLALLLLSPGADATPVDADVLKKLADSDTKLATLYAQGSYEVRTIFQNLDASSGKVSSTNEVETRMFRRDGKPWEEITKYVEDGKDVTAAREAKREKELEEGKRTREAGIPWRSPFGAKEQEKYRFDDLGADGHDPSKIRIHFEPKKATKDTEIGEALVDPAAGTVESITFRPAVRPTFVSKMQITMDFAAATPAGPALSTLTVDAEGGLFFVKKKVHVVTTIDEYETAPEATVEAPRPTPTGPPMETAEHR